MKSFGLFVVGILQWRLCVQKSCCIVKFTELANILTIMLIFAYASRNINDVLLDDDEKLIWPYFFCLKIC